MNKSEAEVCPSCGWRTLVWVSAQEGPNQVCKVCDLSAQIALLRDSRRLLADRADTLEGVVACALADHDGWKQEAMEAIVKGHR